VIAIQPTTTCSTMAYKMQLLEARKLRGKSGVKAFDRAKILCAVFDDDEFRAECGNLDDFRAAALLDEYVDDLAVGFLDLRAMYKYYPRRSSWREGRLGKMLREMLRANETVIPAARPPRVATAETRKQLTQQLEEARREKARLKQTKEDELIAFRQTKETELAQLRSQIMKLKAENNRLRQLVIDLGGTP